MAKKTTTKAKPAPKAEKAPRVTGRSVAMDVIKEYDGQTNDVLVAAAEKLLPGKYDEKAWLRHITATRGWMRENGHGDFKATRPAVEKAAAPAPKAKAKKVAKLAKKAPAADYEEA